MPFEVQNVFFFFNFDEVWPVYFFLLLLVILESYLRIHWQIEVIKIYPYVFL